MDSAQQIIDNIKIIRKGEGLTQDDMAQALDISRATYVNIENGKSSPTLDELTKICEILNISSRNLLYPTTTQPANETKFQQMYLYVLQNHFADEGVPKTKLAKILYLADFASYYFFLRPMSNVTYIHRQYGPVAAPFFILTDELYDQGTIRIRLRDFAQFILPTHSSNDTSLLDDHEKTLLDHICRYWKDRRTAEIVGFTHSQKPYQQTNANEPIAYELILQEQPNHVFAPISASVNKNHGDQTCTATTSRRQLVHALITINKLLRQLNHDESNT